jgi:hypothetical protein
MARFEGIASIRRALSLPNGTALLDIKPEGSQWRWTSVPSDRARVALACGIAAISGGWKLYVSLPDDPTSNVLEIVGLSRTADRPETAGAAPGLVLHVVVSPAPHAGTQVTYTVKVTDASASPVEQVAVTLHNYSATGADDVQTHNTDGGGEADFPNVTLRSKTTVKHLPEGERITTVTPPNLTASKDGFSTVHLNLL